MIFYRLAWKDCRATAYTLDARTRLKEMVRFEDAFRVECRALVNLDNDVCAPGPDPHLQARGLASAALALSYLLRPGFRMTHASMWSRRGVYFWAAGWKRRYQLPEKDEISPDELLSALKRYLEESGDTEQTVASKIGMNHHTLHRWLSDNESPKKGEGKLALTALFLRRAGYL